MSILNKPNTLTEAQLRKMVQGKFGLFLDFDGTLSEIVDVPDEAKLYRNNGELLKELSEFFPITILSGRSIESLLKRIKLPNLRFVGNHGMEILKDGEVVLPAVATSYLKNVADAFEALQTEITDKNVFLENKKITISVHYRNVSDPETTKTILTPMVEKIAQDHQLEAFSGRMIFELRPPIEIHKGVAFEQIVRAEKMTAALMIGDDVTDTHAFIAAQKLRLANECDAFSLAVIDDETASEVIETADFTLSGVEGANQFLSSLLMVTKESST